MPHPFIPAPNCASVELIYTNAGEVNENVFHVRKGSPFSLSDLQTLRGVVNSWDAATAAGGRASAATLTRIRTKALDTNSSPMEDYYLPTPRAGGIGVASTPLNVAFCCKLATGLAGRSYRGRWYWGNIPASFLADAGNLAHASAVGLTGFLNTLISNLNSAGYTMVVVSYYNNGAWRTTAVATPVTNAVAVDESIDSQRRRLRGRGHAL